MDQSEVGRIAQADEKQQIREAMNAFIAKLSPKRQARVSIVCGAIVEAGDPVGSLNRQFWSDRAQALAVQIANKQAGR
jgi:hypothetical protein